MSTTPRLTEGTECPTCYAVAEDDGPCYTCASERIRAAATERRRLDGSADVVTGRWTGATAPEPVEPITAGEKAAAGWTPEPDPAPVITFRATCSVPGCHDEEAHERYRVAADTAAVYRERAETMRKHALARALDANEAERRWRASIVPPVPTERCARTFRRTLDEATVRCTRPAGHGAYCNSYGDPWDGPTETIARLQGR